MSRIESTYKARDVEETIDLYFYRPVGYQIARASHAVAGIHHHFQAAGERPNPFLQSAV
jgi:hypothetical protein